MSETINLTASNASLTVADASALPVLTSGMQNHVLCHFTFADAWNGLQKAVTFRAGDRRVSLLENEWLDGATVAVPPEVLAASGYRVHVGLYGYSGTPDNVILPTVEACIGTVKAGADPSGDAPAEHTLPLWAQTRETLEAEIAEKSKYSLRKLRDYAYEMTCLDIDYDAALEYYASKEAEVPPACSAIRNGNYIGRNLDWTYDQKATFVVHIPHSEERRASVNLCGGISELTEEFVRSGRGSNAYKILPCNAYDGINESGVFASMLVVPTDKGFNRGIPTEDQREEMPAPMLVRYILDHFDTAYDAADYIRKHVAVYFPKALHDMQYELHFMIADANYIYCLEFIDNAAVILDISENPILTNFYLSGAVLNADGTVYTPDTQDETHNAHITNHITNHGAGLERFNLLQRRLEFSTSKSDMRFTMDELKYSRTYPTAPYPERWLTEFVGGALTCYAPPYAFEGIMARAGEAYTSRDRNDPKTWHTVHSCVYDIRNRAVSVVFQEDGEEIEFSIRADSSQRPNAVYVEYGDEAVDFWELKLALENNIPVRCIKMGGVVGIYEATGYDGESISFHNAEKPYVDKFITASRLEFGQGTAWSTNTVQGLKSVNGKTVNENGKVDLEGKDIPFDNTDTDLDSDNVEDALREVAEEAFKKSAADISFDNTNTEFEADNVEEALKELAVEINDVEDLPRGIPYISAESLDGINYAAAFEGLPEIRTGSNGHHSGKGTQILFVPSVTSDSDTPTLRLNGGEAIPICLRSDGNRGNNDERPSVAVPLTRHDLLQVGVPYQMTFCGVSWMIDSLISGVESGDEDSGSGIESINRKTGKHITLTADDVGAALASLNWQSATAGYLLYNTHIEPMTARKYCFEVLPQGCYYIREEGIGCHFIVNIALGLVVENEVTGIRSRGGPVARAYCFIPADAENDTVVGGIYYESLELISVTSEEELEKLIFAVCGSKILTEEDLLSVISGYATVEQFNNLLDTIGSSFETIANVDSKIARAKAELIAYMQANLPNYDDINDLIMTATGIDVSTEYAAFAEQHPEWTSFFTVARAFAKTNRDGKYILTTSDGDVFRFENKTVGTGTDAITYRLYWFMPNSSDGISFEYFKGDTRIFGTSSGDGNLRLEIRGKTVAFKDEVQNWLAGKATMDQVTAAINNSLNGVLDDYDPLNVIRTRIDKFKLHPGILKISLEGMKGIDIETYQPVLQLWVCSRKHGTASHWWHPSQPGSATHGPCLGYAGIAGDHIYANEPLKTAVFPPIPAWMPNGGWMQTEIPINAGHISNGHIDIDATKYFLPMVKPKSTVWRYADLYFMMVQRERPGCVKERYSVPVCWKVAVLKNGKYHTVGTCENIVKVGFQRGVGGSLVTGTTTRNKKITALYLSIK